MADSFSNILSTFSKKNILVLGDFMLDEYINGSVERISPEAPVPVVLEKNSLLLPGGAGNVVCNLRALDCCCSIIGMVGQDEGAQLLNDHFKTLGLSADDFLMIKSTHRPTTRKTRIMSGNHQMLRLDREDSSSISQSEEDSIIQKIESRVKDVDAVIISDYDKGLVTPRVIQKTVELAQKNQCFISVDPQVTNFDTYKNVDILTPNHHEAGRYLGRRIDTTKEIERAGFEIMERLNSKMLLITRGENGMSLFIHDKNQAYHVPTMAREVFDVTGAGDTVISLFTLAIVSGADPMQSVVISNKAAGLVVAQVGAATVSHDGLLVELEKEGK